MFEFMGKKAAKGAINGAVETIEAQGLEIGERLGKGISGVISGLSKVPVLNIPPFFLKVMSEIPDYWEGLPKEQRQALFNAAVAAGTKAMYEYAASTQNGEKK